MRQVVGDAANPHHILQTRVKLDKALFCGDDDFVEIDIDPHIDNEEVNILAEEYGAENVQLAYYYIYRHRLFKMGIVTADELTTDDLFVFLLIEEEQGLREAQTQASLKDSNR